MDEVGVGTVWYVWGRHQEVVERVAALCSSWDKRAWSGPENARWAIAATQLRAKLKPAAVGEGTNP